MKEDEQPESLGPCPLCGRIMIRGHSLDRHHWQPKSLSHRQPRPKP
jgi:hypothetical protein